MTHEICDACECVSHCKKNGCVPMVALPACDRAGEECTMPREVVREAPSKSLNALVADHLRPFLKRGQKVIWREPFRWFDDNGVLSNHYDGMSVRELAEVFGYDYDWELTFEHAAIVWPKPIALAQTKEQQQ